MIPSFAWFLWLVIACISAYYAKERGRNPYIWFFIGFLGSLPGLLILFILPRKTAKKTEEPALANQENLSSSLKPPVGSSPFWYYLDPSNQQLGPMSFHALEEAWREGKVTLQTYVWNETMENWKLFSEIIPSPASLED